MWTTGQPEKKERQSKSFIEKMVKIILLSFLILVVGNILALVSQQIHILTAVVELEEQMITPFLPPSVAEEEELSLSSIKKKEPKIIDSLLNLLKVGGGSSITSSNSSSSMTTLYRGILVDLARNYFPIPVLKQIIQFLSLLHLPILHLHLSDDQGFMIQLNSIPGTPTTKNGTLYTKDEMMALEDYASRHGVVIVPEIGVPGHAGGWIDATTTNTKSKKYVVACPREACRTAWSIPLDVSTPQTVDLVYSVISELINDVFPRAPFIHLGGDEIQNADKCFREAGIKSNRNMFETQLAARLIQQQQYDSGSNNHSKMKKQKKVIIRWQESVNYNHDIIQVWSGGEDYPSYCKAGTPCIISRGLYWDKGDIDVWSIYQVAVKLQQLYNPFGLVACAWEMDVPAFQERNIWGNLVAFSIAFQHPNLTISEFRTMYHTKCISLLRMKSSSSSTTTAAAPKQQQQQEASRAVCYIPVSYTKFKKRFHWREGQRDAMVCSRISDGRLPCRTNNCPDPSGNPEPPVLPVQVFGVVNKRK